MGDLQFYSPAAGAVRAAAVTAGQASKILAPVYKGSMDYVQV